MILMIANHFFNAYDARFGLPDWLDNWQVILTRGAFIIFCFLISEGLVYTKSRTKFFLRLLLFGFISEMPADLCFTGKFPDWTWQNVFFELATGVAVCSISDLYQSKFSRFHIVFIGCIFAFVLNFDYGIIGVLLIYSFYRLRESKYRLPLSYLVLIAATLIHMSLNYVTVYPTISFMRLWPYIWRSCLHEFASLLGFVLLVFYNGKKGPVQNKYLFYIVYPLHLLLIWILVWKIF